MPEKFKKLTHFIVGPPLNIYKDQKHILLIAFFAWVGLGADGLSSSCYGPEEAFISLGQHSELGLYLAIATALTVFIIGLSYNQVIELFPTGGGGYKVATKLISPVAGLISGSGLIVDYILTITISVASGIDAIFSLLPLDYQNFKLPTEFLLIILLILLNLRGAKESIKILMPIFVGFFITHAFLIIYGISVKFSVLPDLIPKTVSSTLHLSQELGWIFVASLFLKAYSLGGGTYTGIEAVSNNINLLAEPRVRTGKWTMLYMAVSLSFTAGGIILLYLLWHATPIPGQTLNAVTFHSIMSNWHWEGFDTRIILLPLVLFFEAALLFVAANTGFLGGPAVLANMAYDYWAPNQFKYLSSRLVTQNGVLFMGIAAIILLFITEGDVKILVILYSINVFLTFTLSLLGLSIHWLQVRKKRKNHKNKWFFKLVLSGIGLLVSAGILFVTLTAKFMEGAWMTVCITGFFMAVGFLIKKHYHNVEIKLGEIIVKYYKPEYLPKDIRPKEDFTQPTAVIFVDRNVGLGMHTLEQIQKLFPHIYKNYVFMAVGQFSADLFGQKEKQEQLLESLDRFLQYFVNYSHNQGFPAAAYYDLGTNITETATALALKIKDIYPNCVFFAGDLHFEHETWFTRWLYDHTPVMIQRALHFIGIQMVLLPMRLKA